MTCPNGKSVSNEKCCALFPVLEDIQANLFDHGECGEDAHSALRIAFHDAIGYSTTRKEAYVFPSSSVCPENNATSKPGVAGPMVPFTPTPRKNWLIMRTMALMRLSRARRHSLRDTRKRSHRVICESYDCLIEAGPLSWTLSNSFQHSVRCCRRCEQLPWCTKARVPAWPSHGRPRGREVDSTRTIR